jgi:nicotinate-nucleotide pyrophosphorylase (carboxylating)
MIFKKKLTPIILNALKEDIGEEDWTSFWLIPQDKKIEAKIIAKESGVIAGLEVAKVILNILDKENNIKFEQLVKDGTRINKGKVVAQIFGSARLILKAERTILNFLQRMSGIATLTRQFVIKVKDTKVVILDTRKTAPGLRLLDKWAVKLGGGKNHRFGLFDMILIKNNHLKIIGKPAKAILLVKEKNKKNLEVEIEVKDLNQLKQVLKMEVKRILLDNMSIKQIKEAVKLTDGKAKLEVSGGVNLDNVYQIAQTGVDYISVGALTHSPKALDISIEF